MRDTRNMTLLDELAAHARARHGEHAAVMVDLGTRATVASIADARTAIPCTGTRSVAAPNPGTALRMLGARYLGDHRG